MKLAHSLSLVLAAGIVGAPAWAAPADEHQAHHPAGAASAAASRAMRGQSSVDTARMEAQMKTMATMHDRMMAAKTTEERNGLMAEHMKAMQEGMAMMNGMSAQGTGGMKGEMAAHHRMMEKRMEMMQATMQMMMDRLPAAPTS